MWLIGVVKLTIKILIHTQSININLKPFVRSYSYMLHPLHGNSSFGLEEIFFFRLSKFLETPQKSIKLIIQPKYVMFYNLNMVRNIFWHILFCKNVIRNRWKCICDEFRLFFQFFYFKICFFFCFVSFMNLWLSQDWIFLDGSFKRLRIREKKEQQVLDNNVGTVHICICIYMLFWEFPTRLAIPI